tara:strand:- start:32 stop:646 length:615 start_codon:yes stop_codon:yes gene_type:complete
MKLCVKCNNEKDGTHKSYCKSCMAKRSAEYYQKNKEKINEIHKEYLQNNKEKILEKEREYRQNNKERITKYKKEYRQNNKEKILEKEKEYRQNNKEKLSEYNKEYRQKNPHKKRESDRKRKALKRANIHKPYSEKQVLKLYGTSCHICKEGIDMFANRSVGAFGWQRGLHIDHVIPLSKGGPDTIDNVRPAHGLCNLQKFNSIL